MQQEQLHPGAGVGLPTVEPGRKHAAVVEDHDVARSEPLGKVVEAAVLHPAGAAGKHEQSGVVPRLRGRLGYQLLGEPVVEVARLHRKRCQASELGWRDGLDMRGRRDPLWK